jgi:hypothetical protein
MLIASNPIFSQITYVDFFDAVYPYPTATTGFNLDINNDLQPDIKLQYNIGSLSTTCGSSTGTGHVTATFQGLSNSFGQNKVNAPISSSVVGIDCTNDTLNVLDLWNNSSKLYYGWFPLQSLCLNIGVGTHKQGFRLILTNPLNGSLGYKYGYIDYTITSGGDVIIHGWYYEDTFNVPIVANSQLDYPYDGNCIHYDTVTVTVHDTITTTIYDTLTTQVFDTVLVSVTDTLFIETTLSTLPLVQNTLEVYPNPTNDFLHINTGNLAVMSGYSIKIENNLGQVVFSNLINQQEFIINLTTWSGNGVYYLKIFDPQNNQISLKKIVLQ